MLNIVEQHEFPNIGRTITVYFETASSPRDFDVFRVEDRNALRGTVDTIGTSYQRLPRRVIDNKLKTLARLDAGAAREAAASRETVEAVAAVEKSKPQRRKMLDRIAG